MVDTQVRELFFLRAVGGSSFLGNLPFAQNLFRLISKFHLFSRKRPFTCEGIFFFPHVKCFSGMAIPDQTYIR